LEAEQAYIDFAYECLDATRRAAEEVRDTVVHEPGGTFQARYERDVIWDRVAARLAHLELGDSALMFGRIDRDALPTARPRAPDQPLTRAIPAHGAESTTSAAFR
jgi:hypothetical protein